MPTELLLAARVRIDLVQSGLPSWLLTPGWFRPLGRSLGHFVRQHEGIGLFLVIFAEELGIPLPAPGDVAIAWGGYLTTTGAIALWQAYAAVIGGALIGSYCLFSLSRRFGHPFVVRYGRYVGLRPDRLRQAESAFQRWGAWAIIIGRLIPGMRIVLSALSGVLEVPSRVFVPSVAVSATIWAIVFLTAGRLLGRRVLLLFRLVPIHLLPAVLVALFVIVAVIFAFERGWHRRETAGPAADLGPRPPKAEVTPGTKEL